LTLSERVNKIGVSPTMRVAQQAIEMKARGEHVIDLSVGEPDFPTPQNIKDAAIKAINENFTKYTVNAGIIQLREAISRKLQIDNNLEYSPDNIIVSTGAKQSIFNAIQSIVCNDDEVITSSPYYVSYPEIVTLANGRNVIIPTTEETGFKITAEKLKSAITPKTKLLILCNPCNPTGTAYTKQELEELAEIFENGNFYILTDEIYEKLVYDDLAFFSVASLSEKIKAKTVLINGHSKSYSMTGWRLGYAAAPDEIVKAMHKYQSHSTSATCSISQAAGLEALLGQQKTVEEARKEFERRRNYFHSALTSINGLTCYKPQGAFYLFPNVSAFFHKSTHVFKIENSFDLAMYLISEAKVAVVPGSAFGSEGYIRMSYSTSMENLEEGAGRIKEALALLS
jgi:aspartate aminotransferase